MGVKFGVWYVADVWVQRVKFNPAYGISDSRGCGNECDRDSWNLTLHECNLVQCCCHLGCTLYKFIQSSETLGAIQRTERHMSEGQ